MFSGLELVELDRRPKLELLVVYCKRNRQVSLLLSFKSYLLGTKGSKQL